MRQPTGVAGARREVGERRALVEIEQVQGQLGGGVAGGEAVQDIDEERTLARAGPAADQPVRRLLVEAQDQRAVTVAADNGGEAVAAVLLLLNRAGREQVGKAQARRVLTACGEFPADALDQVRRWVGVEQHRHAEVGVCVGLALPGRRHGLDLDSRSGSRLREVRSGRGSEQAERRVVLLHGDQHAVR